MLTSVLQWLGGHAAWLLFGGVTAGLLFPALAALAWPLVLPVTFLLLVASVMRLDAAAAIGHARRPLKPLLVVAVQMVAAPLAVAAVVKALPLPPTLASALVLTATTTPLLSSPAFCLLLGLEAELALIVLMGTMIAVPFTMPQLALSLLDLEIALGPAQFMGRLALFVGAGFATAAVLRRWIGARAIRGHARALDGVNVLLLVAFAVAVMDGVTARFLSDPRHVGLFVAAAFLFNLTLQAFAALAFLPAGRRTALTAGFLCGYRNMPLPLVVLGAAAPADFALYVAVAQLPMYMLPAVMLPAYRRLLGR
jgi:BASS family bile acid:Na+ symporter